jgi:putative nucleotidyltransferase with HDIG domain
MPENQVDSSDRRCVLYHNTHIFSDDEDMATLRDLYIIDKTNTATLNDEIRAYNCAKEMTDKFSKIDGSLMRESCGIINDVLFGTDTSPWLIFIKIVSNYVDWLYTHSINVAFITLILAQLLNYKKESLNNLCLGALLHDVGKLMIPRSIIQKPGKLSNQEMSQMKGHCELGFNLVKGFDLPKESTDIILQHQERLDGSGYPYGLRKDRISEGSQIVMVADVLDAITSYRPYKKTQTLDVAIESINSDEAKFSKEIISLLSSF